MNTQSNQSYYPALALLLLLGACSGGSINVSVDGGMFPQLPPGQTSEPVTAQGVITGLGGVTVNDVRYSTNTATVTVNGDPGLLSDLRHGQIVTVQGRIDSLGWSGTANGIFFDADVIGPVENLDAANSRITVMGQIVDCDLDTQFGPGIDPTTFAGLSAGSIVQVSGYADAAGAIRATRIDTDLTNAELQIIGKIDGVDLANLLFEINQLTADYSGALVIDLAGGSPINGMMVKAVGTLSNGRLIVERLVAAPALAGNTGQRVQIAGVVTRFNSSSDFDINNHTARVISGTAFRNGDAGDLALNAEIVIDGDFASDGRIMTNRVTFGHLLNNTTTLTFGFSDFTEISVPTVFHLVVTQGPVYSVAVTVDEEVVDHVNVTKTSNRLTIDMLPGGDNIETLEAVVTMPMLDRIDLDGVVSASLNGFNQSQMTVNVGGVSLLRGNELTIGNLTADVSGVSQLAFGSIRPIGSANINVSGVSQATLNMDVGSTMTGSVGTGQGTGTSTLFYYGTNVNMNVTQDSISSIVRLGETRP